MHPFAKARERTRALNAAKMERIFAKPFVAAMEGHIEAVETMSRRPESLTAVASGSWDGGMCVMPLRLAYTSIDYTIHIFRSHSA